MDKESVVQSVDISTIAHATDDLDRVLAALRFVLPESLREREIFNRRYLEGHHRNPIVTFEAKLKKPSETEAFAKSLFERLTRTQKVGLERELESCSDTEGNLFIRIDKQQALRGSIQLTDDDPIRVKIKFTRLRGEARNLMKQALRSE